MIEVVETPPLNIVVDQGRSRARCYGIGRSGAMDRPALAVGNALLGNAADAAGIEFQLYPVRLRFLADTAIAVTGADCGARLDGQRLPPCWAVPVRAGQELALSVPRNGMRGYLAVLGGVDVPAVLGSRTTSLRAGFGGLEGRDLRAGDRLAAGPAPLFRPRDPAGFGAVPPSQALLQAALPGAAEGDVVLRVVPAAEYEQFDAASQEAFWTLPWQVTSQSNRMGYRLAGETLRRTRPVEMRSHGIVPGVVQVPPAGQPIIQMEDGNSAGGYPKIGVVIEADLWRISQASPGRALRFVRCSLEQARAAERELADYLAGLRRLAAHARLPAQDRKV